MQCPTLNELPPPPPGRSGWPWTEESRRLPAQMPDGVSWPRVSIVTPSFNQAQFLEETIRSVLLQGYPDLEYMVIDGGSSDGSVDVIRKYEPWLAHWVSEPDAGQSDALNKGFSRATGSIVAWINSDDAYLPDVLPPRVAALVEDPDVALVYGDCHIVDETGERIETWRTRQATATSLLLDGNQIPQQSTFFRGEALASIGGADPALHYVMDFTLWLRLSLVGALLYVPGPVASFRKHDASKTITTGYAFFAERIRWLSTWSDLDRIVAGEEQKEVFRRQHVWAALYATLEGDEAKAASHFDQAFRDGVWPHGDVDRLADVVVGFGGMDGHHMRDSWQRFETLKRVLCQVEPPSMRRRLVRRAAAGYHLAAALYGRPADAAPGAGRHLLAGIWHNPRRLGDRSVLYALGKAVLGRNIMEGIRHMARTMGRDAG